MVNLKSFNSCPRAEGNLNLFENIRMDNIVSIRALARRATREGHGRERQGHRFNSCPRAEGNLFAALEFVELFSFNSCPRAEGNSTGLITRKRLVCFNSCPRAEGNLIDPALFKLLTVSIRALARRATTVRRKYNEDN